ncbi:SDR family oxidoreductase [Alicyclobacillaceae bacterium I2511]|nr:SDR family oxidoreductase [Alicyclobacillaceae bacterium I2511]
MLEGPLKGAVALVTGGSRGIGRATSLLLAQRGATVVVNFAANVDAAQQVVATIQSQGGTAVALQGDVRNPEQIHKIVEQIEDKWGKLDILVCNAAMQFVMKTLDEMSWEEFNQKLTDEMKAAFLLTKAVTPGMTKRHYGRIVYVASGLAKHTGPRMAAHGTAKAALVQFARYVAAEYGPKGITANVISPGLVQTEATQFQPAEFMQRVASITPLGHVAQPADIAHAIAMYVGEDSRFITGVYIPVNGGAAME